MLNAASQRRLEGVYLDGPADLAIEVVSPTSRLRDRGEKLGECEMGGVREYCVIDPEEQRADFCVLAADGRYERRRTGEDGIYPSYESRVMTERVLRRCPGETRTQRERRPVLARDAGTGVATRTALNG